MVNVAFMRLGPACCMLIGIAGCRSSPPPTVAPPPAARPQVTALDPTVLTARWTLTRPDIAGDVNVAVAGQAIYVVGCQEESSLPPTQASFVVSKVNADGKVAWRKQLVHRCWSRTHMTPIAASDLGVVVAVPLYAASGGVNAASILAFDPRGAELWERRVRGDIRRLQLVASRERVAVCVDSGEPGATPLTFEGTALDVPRWGLNVVELDRAGGRIASHVMSDVTLASCTYDEEDDDLWLTVQWYRDKPIELDDVVQPVAPGIWAIRLRSRPAFVHVSRGPHTSYKAVASGVVVHVDGSGVTFADHRGQPRWHIDVPSSSCVGSPWLIDASPTRLVVGLDLRHCGSGAATFDGVRLEHLEHSLENRIVLLDLDPMTHKPRLLKQLGLTMNLRVVVTAFGMLAFGDFDGAFAFDRRIHSSPRRYDCIRRGDRLVILDYAKTDASCEPGFDLETWYPTWPYAAALH